MKFHLLALLATLTFSITTAHANPEYPAPFVITKTKVANATNYHYRVYSDGNWHCYNGPKKPCVVICQ